MKKIDASTLVLATLAHVLDRLKAIDRRLIDIEDSVVDDDRTTDVDDQTVEALADQLLDAADEIEERDCVPDSNGIAERLRDVAAQLTEEAE